MSSIPHSRCSSIFSPIILDMVTDMVAGMSFSIVSVCTMESRILSPISSMLGICRSHADGCSIRYSDSRTTKVESSDAPNVMYPSSHCTFAR